MISQACLRQRWENIGPWSFFYPSRLCFYYQNLAPILLQDGRYVCLARYSYCLCTIQTMGTEYTHTNLHASFETCSNREKSCTKTSLTNLLLLSHWTFTKDGHFCTSICLKSLKRVSSRTKQLSNEIKLHKTKYY